MSSLESTAPGRAGAIALLGAQWGRYAVQVGGIVILARLIAPADFGLVALGLALSGFAAVLGDFGLSLAALRAPRLSVAQRDLLFWINTLVGVVASAIVVVAAFPVSSAYDDSRLVPVMLLLAPAFALRSASVQYRVELNRAGRLGTLAVVEFLGDAVGLVAAALLAWSGAGVVGLSLQGTIAATVTLVAAIATARWRPGRPRRDAPIRSLLSFGGNTFVVHLLNYTSANIGTMTVGAASGAAVLGLFSRANQLVNLPLEQLASPLTRIVIPALSRAASTADLQRRLGRFQVLLCYPVLGYVSLLTATAHPAIHVVLGAEWEPAADVVPLLAVGALFQTLGYVGYWAFVAAGRPGLLLGAEAVGRAVMIGLAIVWAPYGPGWVAAAIACGHAVVWIGSTFVFLPRAGLSGWSLARSAGRALLVTATALSAAVVVDAWLLRTWDPLPRLAGLVAVWTVAALCCGSVFARPDVSTIRRFIRPHTHEATADRSQDGVIIDDDEGRTMRIVSVTRTVPHEGIPHAGGEYALRHARALRALGHEVVFVAPNTNENRRAVSTHDLPGTVVLYGEPGDERPSALARSMRRLSPARVDRWEHRRLARCTAAHDALNRADVVEFHWTQSADLSRIAMAHTRPDTRSLVVLHDVMTQQVRRQRESGGGGPSRRALRSLKLWFVRAAEARAVSTVDAAIVFSEKDAGVARELAPTSTTIRVLRPPLSEAMDIGGDRHRHVVESDHRAEVLYVGWFRRDDNARAAEWLYRDVWPLVRESHPDAHLTLAGADPTPAMIEAARTDASIEVTGYQESLDSFYARADVAAIPVLQGAGVKFKTVLALLWGIPVVSTSVGLEGITEDPASIWRRADEPRAFAEGIIDALSDRAAAATIARAGQTWAREEFSEKRFHRELSELLSELTAPTPRADV